nr:SGNH hydrolase domain-containing protein [Nocardioides perillae]
MRRLDRDLGDLGACDYSTSTRRLCPRGDRDAKRVAVVLGDSHGRFWIPALDAIGARDGWRIYYLVKQQCTAAHVMVAQIGSGKRFTACRDFHRWADRQVERLDPRLVVVSTSAPSGGVWVGGRRVTDAEGVRAEMRRGYQRLVEAVRPDTRRLVLLRDVPRVGFDPQPCLSDSSNDLGDCLQRPGKASEQMNQVPVGVFRQRRLPVVDTRRWVCWDGQCPAVVGNVVTYRDRGHLTASYTATLSGAVGRALRMTG